MRKKLSSPTLALILALSLVFSSGCSDGKKPTGDEDSPAFSVPSEKEEDAESDVFISPSLMAKPPAEGTPADHTGMENVSYMAYVLAHRSAYQSESFGSVNTKIGFISYRQEVETYKDCKGGILIATDVARSSLVNTATQTCYVGDRVLWRTPASKSAKDWDGRNTRWADGTPSIASVNDYVKTYGLPSTEFSVYRLTPDTLTDWSDVTDNGDGTYTQSIYPNPATATAYYAVRMQAMGGLSDLPVFSRIEITYTFDASWRVLSAVTRETYAIDLGILHADNCTATMTETFSYDEEAVDISAYDAFFSRYATR